ncbi:MAG: hypothetical protein LBL21_04295 [Rickettsiales bacterium]|jgi:hypothetical protein|nr:hypothetical protein [Rickettsiales bacterium]
MKKLIVVSVCCAIAAPFAAFAGVVDELGKECEDFKAKYSDYGQIICSNPFPKYIEILKAEQKKISETEAKSEQSAAAAGNGAQAQTPANGADAAKSKEIIEQLLKIATNRAFYELYMIADGVTIAADGAKDPKITAFNEKIGSLSIEQANPEIVGLIKDITESRRQQPAGGGK